MNIAINATYRLHGGGFTHLKHLLDAWSRIGVDREHTIWFFTRAENIPALQGSLSKRIKIYAIGRRPMNLAAKMAWEQLVFPRVLAKLAPDVLLCPGNMLPLRSPVPAVVVFHNAGPFCPSVTLRSTGVHDWLWLKLLGAMMRLSAHAADRVIFISEYFKDLFVRHFRFPAERGDVIYHGRDTLSAKQLDPSLLQQLGIGAPYLLSVSNLYPYKNIPALIEGYALARHTLQARGLRLVLAGKPRSEGYYQQLKGLIHRHGLEDWFVLTGGVAHHVIGSLLAGCEFFVFQSLCESISMSLMEALMAGVPVACSNAGVMPEIAGNAALYFDPFDPADIASALTRMAEDGTLRDDLRQRAHQQAMKFPTWDEVGQMTLHSLRRAVGDC
jgi:glycosyltransferase involved in cell wall biosynthesis